MLQLQVTPVVGLPQFTGWSQVAESIASVSVRMVVVYAIFGRQAGTVGRDIGEKISDFYFYDIEQLHGFLQELITYTHDRECKLFFSCAVFGRNKSIFATYGGSIFLKRAEKSGRMLASDDRVKIVEGMYSPEDTFVLTTLQADQFLNEIQLKFQQGYDTDVIITSIVPGLHAQADSSLSAMVFITANPEKEEYFRKTYSKEDATMYVETESEYHQNTLVMPITKQPDGVAITQEKNNDYSQEPHKTSLLGTVESTGSKQDLVYQHEQQTNATTFVSEDTEVKKMVAVSIEVDPIEKTSYVAQVSSKIIRFFKYSMFLMVSFWRWAQIFIIKQSKFAMQKIRTVKISDLAQNVRTARETITGSQVRLNDGNRKKGLLQLLFVVVVIVGLLVGIGYVSYTKSKEDARILNELEPIQADFLLAQTQAETDVISAREKITQALENISTLEKANEKSSAKNRISEKKSELTAYLESISGQEDLQELELFYDLRLARSDFIATGIAVGTNVVLVYDKEMKQILLLEQDSKQVLLKDFSDQDALKNVIISQDKVYVLAEGMFAFSAELQEETELETIRELGDSNRNATVLGAYDRFVYVVNPEKRNIYRYSQTEDGYSEPIGWIKSATGLEYASVISMSIDGSVWLTTNDGAVRKFVSGREETFAVRGLEVPFEGDISLYTNANLENLYVLDPNQNRVVILDKAGDFIREFRSATLGAGTGLAVTHDQGMILVASGSIIYSIPL